MKEPAKIPGFGQSDPTDGRALLDWESRYPDSARASIRREAIYLGAVSYTHLDVYKRQDEKQSLLRVFDIILLIQICGLEDFADKRLNPPIAVSYTHLDVYKRQLHY